ncbi:MAG: restriction endonuclease subunit S [Magnetococcales bacterium]|nr:restriction endonuclease subunit S [Magnetococcales bacterium]
MFDRAELECVGQEFNIVVLGDIAHVEMGQSPDSRNVFEDPCLGYPFLQGNAEFGVVSPEPKYGCIRPAKLAKVNDVLISVRAPVGAINVADRNYCIGRGLAAIRISGIKTSLAAYLIACQSNALQRVAQGTTFEAINKNDLLTLQLLIPPKDELSIIAQILDTLDTSIRETEAIIAKLKAVKQGMLHDLLTRGLDANGELRPPQPEAPHLYKESPLGWIPREWNTCALGDVADSLVDGPFGSNLKTAHYVADPGVRVVRLQNIQLGEYDDSDQAFISSQHAASLARHCVTGGDVLIASLGDNNYPVGRACGYPVELPNAINKADCFRFRARDGLRNAFVVLFMNGLGAREQVRRYEQGVTMKRINLGNLRRVMVSIPSLHYRTLF